MTLCFHMATLMRNVGPTENQEPHQGDRAPSVSSIPIPIGTIQPTQRHTQAPGLTSAAPIAAAKATATTTATPEATASPTAAAKATPATSAAATATSAAAARVHVHLEVPASGLCAIVLASSTLQDTMRPTVSKRG